MSTTAVSAGGKGESCVALGDELFMLAIDVADKATRANKPANCLVEVDRTVRAPGLSGLLLRRQRTYKSYDGAWEIGPIGAGRDSQCLALGRDGTIYFALGNQYNYGGGDQLPTLLGAEEVDHDHLGRELPARVVLQLLQTFEAWGLPKG